MANCTNYDQHNILVTVIKSIQFGFAGEGGGQQRAISESNGGFSLSIIRPHQASVGMHLDLSAKSCLIDSFFFSLRDASILLGGW